MFVDDFIGLRLFPIMAAFGASLRLFPIKNTSVIESVFTHNFLPRTLALLPVLRLIRTPSFPTLPSLMTNCYIKSRQIWTTVG